MQKSGHSLTKKRKAHQAFQEKPKLRTWTEERKEDHGKQMREYWANIKAQERGPQPAETKMITIIHVRQRTRERAKEDYVTKYFLKL